MSTRSNIIMRNVDGSCEVIYCHSDGYLAWNGRMLLDHYQDLNKVNDLISLGDISVLKENVHPNPNKPHNFEERQSSVVVAYGRDRGEQGVESRYYKNVNVYLSSLGKYSGIEYLYLYDILTRTWFYDDRNGDGFRILTYQDIAREMGVHVEELIGDIHD